MSVALPLADRFQALADPTRLRIVALLRLMELSVGELAQVLGQSQPRVSRHLKILADVGVLERRKEGSWVFLTLIGAVCVGLVTIGAQGPRRDASASRPYVVGKNAYGQPNLEATWSNDSITPLQRPAAWAGKTSLTDAEVEEGLRDRAKATVAVGAR